MTLNTSLMAAKTAEDPTAGTGPSEVAQDDDTNAIQGLDVLGKTFNANTGSFTEVTSMLAIDGIENPKEDKEVTSDSDGQTYWLPVGVQYVDSPAAMLGTTATGESKSNFSSSLSVRASVDARYGAFEGSVDASYGTEVTATSQDYYVETFDSWSYYDLGFNSIDVDISTTDLQATDQPFCLTTGMQAAFDGFEIDDTGRNATDFFKTYGTHVVTGIVMGGQCRYAMFGSQSDYQSASNFSVNAEAKYTSLTASAAFGGEISGATESGVSSVQSQTTIAVIGGSTEATAALRQDPTGADYEAWFNSVPDNVKWIDYQSGGVSPLWALCNDPDKSAYLESTFGQLSGSDGYIFETYDRQETEATDGNEPWNSDSSRPQAWKSGSKRELIVGFGGNIGGTGHVLGMIIVAYRLDSGEYALYYTGYGDADTEWQAFYMAPLGYAITGIGIGKSEYEWTYLHVWYQKFQLADQNEVYLDSEVTVFSGSSGSEARVDPAALPAGSGWCQGGSSTVEQLNRYYAPDEGNQYVLTGIDVGSSSDLLLDPGYFNYLVIDQQHLRLDSSINANEDGQAG